MAMTSLGAGAAARRPVARRSWRWRSASSGEAEGRVHATENGNPHCQGPGRKRRRRRAVRVGLTEPVSCGQRTIHRQRPFSSNPSGGNHASCSRTSPPSVSPLPRPCPGFAARVALAPPMSRYRVRASRRLACCWSHKRRDTVGRGGDHSAHGNLPAHPRRNAGVRDASPVRGDVCVHRAVVPVDAASAECKARRAAGDKGGVLRPVALVRSDGVGGAAGRVVPPHSAAPADRDLRGPESEVDHPHPGSRRMGGDRWSTDQARDQCGREQPAGDRLRQGSTSLSDGSR